MIIQTSTASIYVADSCVIIISVIDGSSIDTAETIENYEASLRLNPEGDFPVVFETEGFVTISKESRELAAGDKMTTTCPAMAIIADNIAMRLFANFYIKINKPIRPTRAFTSREKAIEWCKKIYREKNAYVYQ